MIAIICVYNKREIYQKCLLKSLQAQNTSFELIALDNTDGRFSSAAQALNYGADQIASKKSRYIMFVHQDIDLNSNSTLSDAENFLKTLPNLGIAGVAGRRGKGEAILSNITHGQLHQQAGKPIEQPVEVMTVDECCIFIPRDVFIGCRFDELACTGWHTYAVDFSLSITRKNMGVYVIPLKLHHLSDGQLDRAYFKTLKRVLHKHKNNYREICSTCGCWSTREPVLLQMIKNLGFKKIDRLYRALVPRVRLKHKTDKLSSMK